jgi:dipeptidyl aminopeptidase/acylaminoacyl peptidase
MRHLGSGVLLLSLALGIGAACAPKPDVAEQSRRGPSVAEARPAPPASGLRLASSDLYGLKSVGDVHLSPDGRRIAYSVTSNDRPGRPHSQVWLTEVAAGGSVRFGSDNEAASGARWSPDGQWIAYFGREDEGAGLVVSRAAGSSAVLLAPVTGTNHPLPSTSERLAWSPDGRQIAFISSTPGPETEDANGDPMVITRYLYKPTASEGFTRFNDNRRLHIFVADVASRQVRQLTSGNYYEHSIDWSPRGDEIAFISNREPDPDRRFNYDLFAVRVADGVVRQVTRTRNAEYEPKWSPDGRTIAFLGTKRTLTSSETTMEDTHVWLIDADGANRRELGGAIDNRQDRLGWAAGGDAVFCTVQERGNIRLYRLPIAGRPPRLVTPGLGERGAVGAWSVAKENTVAYAFATPAAPADLYLKQGDAQPRALTSLNKELLGRRTIAEVESLTYESVDGTPVEAFLTKPAERTPASGHPMVVMIKGGPHGQQGPAFNGKAQVYAAQGYAVLMVNYRGSTGYGQKFADAIFKDQDGGEARDVLAGVDAALAKHPWIDPNRLGIEGGSYGGQLTNWIITQTDRFKAAIPSAGISNLVSFNYMSYYHDYLAVEFGMFPHEVWRSGPKPGDPLGYTNLMDFLWQRSPLRYAARVKTPTMFIHGENDNDVPIAEAEQFFIALKDVGVETVMIRYPREGHGAGEMKHVVDIIDRSLDWYARHFRRSDSQARAR